MPTTGEPIPGASGVQPAEGGTGQIPGFAVTAEETARREAEGQGAEQAAAPEQTEEQQIIDGIVLDVREANRQLGGKVASEIALSDGRVTLIFNRGGIRRGPQDNVYFGVDSRSGAMYLGLSDIGRDAMGKVVNNIADSRDMEKTRNMVNAYSRPVADEDRMGEWQAAFKASKAAALADRETMDRMKAQRAAILDRAKAVVSEPIDINAAPSAPPAAGPAPQGS
jgi:hypothetical protein